MHSILTGLCMSIS